MLFVSLYFAQVSTFFENIICQYVPDIFFVQIPHETILKPKFIFKIHVNQDEIFQVDPHKQLLDVS